jgi:hypothetical protein
MHAVSYSQGEVSIPVQRTSSNRLIRHLHLELIRLWNLTCAVSVWTGEAAQLDCVRLRL